MPPIKTAPMYVKYDKDSSHILLDNHNIQNIQKDIKYIGEMTFKDANNKKVNPMFYKKDAYEKGYYDNCQSTAAVFIARLRGYDIKALPYSDNNKTMFALSRNINLAFIDKETKEPPKEVKYNVRNKEELFNSIGKLIKENEIYLMDYVFSQKVEEEAHVVVCAKDKNSKLFIYDAQSGRVYIKHNTLLNYFNNILYKYSINLTRVDNALLNFDILKNISQGVNND